MTNCHVGPHSSKPLWSEGLELHDRPGRTIFCIEESKQTPGDLK